jgi:small conductance mechanosensitive channel
MKSPRVPLVALLLALLPITTVAQEVDCAVARPAGLQEALALDLAELDEELAGCPDEALGTLIGDLTTLLEERLQALQVAREASDSDEDVEALAADCDHLSRQVGLLASLLSERGVDVAAAEEVLAAARAAKQEELTDPTAPTDVPSALEIPREVLEAQLRPLRRDEVGEQLAAWLGLLQQKCLEVRNVEVASMLAEEADEKVALDERAVGLRGERARLIGNVEAVMESLESKGGDVEEAKSYIESVTVPPPITRWDSALTTARAWVTSQEGGIALALRLGAALLVLFLAWGAGIVLSWIASRAMDRFKGVSGLLKEFVKTTTRRGVVFIGLLLALERLGLDMTPMLAAIGAAGLVIGLALQGTLSNFASGLLIMVYRPFDVGDLISSSGVLGTVDGLTLFTTRITTLDNQSIQVPNNMVWGDVITNLTALPTRRIDMVFGISYGDDFERARGVIGEVLASHEQVLDDPEPTVRVHELGDSSVNFVVRPWVRTADYWEVYWDLTEQVKQRFDAEGISIPFPQRDVHLIAPDGSPADAELVPARRPEEPAPTEPERTA